MTTRPRTVNVAESVRARLQNLTISHHLEFQLVLSEFAIERFLYRLSISRHADDFVLKGAVLFRVWSADRYRATWDLDLLGRAASNVAELEGVVSEVCSIPGDDGITFDATAVRGEVIRTADEDAGIRVRFEARLADARIPMQVDVGFGDVIVPGAQKLRYPTLLDHAAPNVLTYPRETVVAEKVEAMVSLGVTNSRMKDFYDVHVLATSFEFDGMSLSSAIRATFQSRGTAAVAEPIALSPEFLESPQRQTQWRAFLKRGRLQGPASAATLGEDLRRFLSPVVGAIAAGDEFDGLWPAGGPWNRDRR